MSETLEQAIDNLYLVFSRYPKPEKIDGCPCCVDRKTSKSMLHGALRDIEDNEIWGYVFSVFYTVGEVADFKFFLPRILDLLVQFEETALDPEMALSKLVYADWSHWEKTEAIAVEAYLNSAFGSLLELPAEEYPHDDAGRIDNWLCGLARSVEDISPFLSMLDKPKFRQKAANLRIASALVDDEQDEEGWWYPDEQKPEPFAQQLDANRKLVLEWLVRR